MSSSAISRCTTIAASDPATSGARRCVATVSTRPWRRSSGRSWSTCATRPGRSRSVSATSRSTCGRRRRQAVGAELFDALGTMAERLGERASLRVARAGDGSLAAELEVAESYGVHFVSTERSGVTQVCYDGEAFRRVLALGGTGPARVRAALGLTDRRCTDPGLGTTAALELTRWRSEVLDGVDLATLGPEVPAYERARLRLRRSIVQSGSWRTSRRGQATSPPRRRPGRDGQARARARGPVRPRRRRPPHVRRGRAPMPRPSAGRRAPPRAVSICHGRRRDWPRRTRPDVRAYPDVARLRRPPRSSTARTGSSGPRLCASRLTTRRSSWRSSCSPAGASSSSSTPTPSGWTRRHNHPGRPRPGHRLRRAGRILPRRVSPPRRPGGTGERSAGRAAHARPMDTARL